MSRNFQPARNMSKKPFAKPQNLKLSLALPEGTSDSVVSEILEVLANAQFDKLSYPVGTYRYLIDDSVRPDDTRVLTVGYVKSYDPEKEEFTVVIFSQNRDIIYNFTDPGLEVVFNEYNGTLGIITKLNVIPLGSGDTETDVSSDEETEPVE